MATGLTKEEAGVIKSMDMFSEYLDDREGNLVNVIFLSPKQYICYLGMVEKKKEQRFRYVNLEINVSNDRYPYRGFQVRKTGLMANEE